jgi:hypothetical protein
MGQFGLVSVNYETENRRKPHRARPYFEQASDNAGTFYSEITDSGKRRARRVLIRRAPKIGHPCKEQPSLGF